MEEAKGREERQLPGELEAVEYMADHDDDWEDENTAPDGKPFQPYETWFSNNYVDGTDHGRCGPGFAERVGALHEIDAQPYRGTRLTVSTVADQGIAVIHETFTGLAGGTWVMLDNPPFARAWGHYVIANWLLEHTRSLNSYPFRSWNSQLGYWAVEHDQGGGIWHVVTGAAPGLTLHHLQTKKEDCRAGWEFVEQVLETATAGAGIEQWPHDMLDARARDLEQASGGTPAPPDEVPAQP